MGRTVKAEGKTTTEAIEKGLKELGVSKDKVEIKILEEEKRSFYNSCFICFNKYDINENFNKNTTKKR